MLNFFNKNTNRLNYAYHAEDNYDMIDDVHNCSNETLLNKVRKNIAKYATIRSYYNGKYYLMYDIDDESKLKHLSIDYPYVVIRSSYDYSDDHPPTNQPIPKEKHYWVIVDNPQKKWKTFLKDDNWLILSDPKYVEFTDRKGFHIRCFYQNLNKKPILIKELSNIENSSNDFKEFINKIMHHFDNFGLQISALMSNDTKLLDIYNRQRKLERVVKQ